MQRLAALMGGSMSPTPVRTTQLDASLLDSELEGIFVGMLVGAVRTAGGPTGGGRRQLQTEWWLKHALRAIVWKLSVWDHDATHGLVLQNLKYVRADAPMRPPTPRQKALHGAIVVLLRMAHERASDAAEQGSWSVSDSVCIRLSNGFTDGWLLTLLTALKETGQSCSRET